MIYKQHEKSLSGRVSAMTAIMALAPLLPGINCVQEKKLGMSRSSPRTLARKVNWEGNGSETV